MKPSVPMYAPLLLHVLFTDIYPFYTFTRVQILFFFFLFYFFTPFELHHLSTLIFFLLLLLIAKIPLFHSLSLIRIIGLLSSFIINFVLIITTKVHSTRSFRFDFIIIIIFFFSTNEKTCHHYRYFSITLTVPGQKNFLI